MPHLRFAQLSDTHVMLDPASEAHGIRPAETLRRVMGRVRLLDPVPDFLVFSGDLVGDDEMRSYETFREIVESVDIPRYFVVGNHDLRSGIRRVLLDVPADASGLDAPLYYAFARAGVRFLVLDSQIPGDVPGAIGDTQLDWVRQAISADARVPTVVFVHHPPLEIGVPWIDPHHIANGTELLQILSGGNVLHLFFGHVHMPATCSAFGVECSSVPSTCYQFGERDGGFELVAAPPALRVVDMDGERLSSRLIFA